MASNLVQVLKRFTVFVVVVGLSGVVFWLLSERHGRMWGVEKKEDSLWIVRGRELPFGFYTYQPTDKLLAEAYAPIAWSGEPLGELLAVTYDDRDQLDRALFKVLKGWMETRLESDDQERLRETLQLVKRAELLSGIDSLQRQELKEIQVRVSYFEGWLLLRQAEEALRNGVDRLKLAGGAHGKYAREAGELVERVRDLSERLSRSLRVPLETREFGYDAYRGPLRNQEAVSEGQVSMPGSAPPVSDPVSPTLLVPQSDKYSSKEPLSDKLPPPVEEPKAQ